ncbi:glycosyltransferase 87 family protein [Corynebacterium aquilae]|uniref:glycosyltransferase 87 family protein n=1 Tax=Corynebacterium aquilae TaxID=203263 RepID=UPI0009520B46|nr:glycosyltransferase 87 family protein [Corynebacterium aquilae]
MPVDTRLPHAASRLNPDQRTLVVCGIGVGLLLWALKTNFLLATDGFLMDLQVFQDAGRAFRTGGPLFDGFDSRSGFAFIYPPFAALLMAPLAYIPQTALQLGWNLGQFFCVFTIVGAGLYLAGFDKRTSAIYSFCALGVAMSAEPIRNGMGFGQIDTYLAMLVIADVAGILPRKFRGLGVGLAAGIKVTPAAFGLVFLIRRDFGAAARSVAMGVATLVIGFIVRPHDSKHFWLVEMWNTDRAGQKDFFRNQALSGFIARNITAPDTTTFTVLWAGFALVIGAVGLWAMIRYSRRGFPLLSLAMFILLLCYLQPYAVTHHWAIGIIWVAVVIWLFAIGHATRWAALAFGAIQWWGPNFLLDPDRHFATWQRVFGEIQSVTMLVAIVVMIFWATKITDRHPATRKY